MAVPLAAIAAVHLGAANRLVSAAASCVVDTLPSFMSASAKRISAAEAAHLRLGVLQHMRSQETHKQRVGIIGTIKLVEGLARQPQSAQQQRQPAGDNVLPFTNKACLYQQHELLRKGP